MKDREILEFTSLPFNTSTFAKRAIKANLGIPPLPGSAIGLSESLMSFSYHKKNKHFINLKKTLKVT